MNWVKELEKKAYFSSGDKYSGLDALYPPFRVKVERIVERLNARGYDFGVFETFRGNVRQLKLFNEGRTKIKTSGMHYYGVAADIVPKVKGKWTWEVGKEVWDALGEEAKKEGLTWGGNWKFVDKPHVQFISEKEQENIRAGKYPEYEDSGEARLEVVRALRGVYEAAEKAKLSQETMAMLNKFRNSDELKDVKL